MKANRIIIMLLILCLLPVTAFAAGKEEPPKDKNLLEYLARTRPDNKYLVFAAKNGELLFAAAGTIGLTIYYITAQPNKAARGKAAGKVFSQLKKLF